MNYFTDFYFMLQIVVYTFISIMFCTTFVDSNVVPAQAVVQLLG